MYVIVARWEDLRNWQPPHPGVAGHMMVLNDRLIVPATRVGTITSTIPAGKGQQ